MKNYISPIVNPQEIPSGPHFAVIEFDTLHYTDDYNETSSQPLTHYRVFKEEGAWKDYITALSLAKKSFVALTANKIEVKTEVRVLFG